MKKIGVFVSTTLFASIAFASQPVGIYTVPVSPELDQAATFSLENLKVRRHSKEMSLSFQLPEELVGRANYQVKFSGPVAAGRVAVLKGPKGVAHCLDRDQQLNCLMVYKSLQVDPVSVDNVLKQKFGNNADLLQKKIQVGISFIDDPVGVIQIYYPQE